MTRLTTIDVLERLGILLALDWDDTLQVNVDEMLSPLEIKQKLEDLGEPLGQQLLRRVRRDQSVFTGGPLNGQQSLYVVGRTLGVNLPEGGFVRALFHLHHESRGKWAAYVFASVAGEDRRARFIGWAASKKKAMAVAVAWLESEAARV